ncbi:MAG: hypothetical protein FWH15_09560 [Betaproteobacteria bacterium]|nr:hypothetical protein [Betaproteobacteria bacterium]
MSKKLYSVLWFSPRRFANECTYIYGLTAHIEKFCELTANENNHWHWDKRNFTTMATAEKAARRLCNRDHRESPPYELCHINYECVEELLAEHEIYEAAERHGRRRMDAEYADIG